MDEITRGLAIARVVVTDALHSALFDRKMVGVMCYY